MRAPAAAALSVVNCASFVLFFPPTAEIVCVCGGDLRRSRSKGGAKPSIQEKGALNLYNGGEAGALLLSTIFLFAPPEIWGEQKTGPDMFTTSDAIHSVSAR